MAAFPAGIAGRRPGRLRPVVPAFVCAVLVSAFLAACVQHGRPPVSDRSPVFGEKPEHYLVQRGDTLYSIAWRYNMDHRRLALANGVPHPIPSIRGNACG